jgi:hypothetical protein
MFEELELWDSLILCYQMLGKAPQVRHKTWQLQAATFRLLLQHG